MDSAWPIGPERIKPFRARTDRRDSVQAFAALSMLVIGAVTLVVGVRLVWLARRSRRLPEFAFGMAFVTGSLGTALAQSGRRLIWSESGPVTGALNGACFGLVVVGTICLYLVTWRVFRPRARWAAVLCGAGSALALGAWLGRCLAGDLAAGNDRSLPMALFQVVRIAVFAWSAFESFRVAEQLRRRLALGLADPVARMQILLWGVAGAAMVVATGIILLYVLEILPYPLELPLTTALLTGLGLVASASMWCAFFPPARLHRLAAWQTAP